MENCKINLSDLKSFCFSVLLKAGMEERYADTVSDVLTKTDAFGVHTHGTKNLYDYIRKVELGGMVINVEPEVVMEGPSIAVLDGHNTFGMISATKAMHIAIEKCQKTGISAVLVKNSEHFGAAGYYALMAAEAGLIGLAMSNVDANMTIPGAKAKVIGNNPFSYAVPAEKHKPIFLDIALSNVASLKVVQARKDGKNIPADWIIDAEGNPTTDPSHYPEEGAMLPMGAHKGYGLALMVETLTGILSGGAMMTEVPSWLFDMPNPNRVSHMFICLDQGKFIDPDLFKKRVDDAIDKIHNTPRAKSCDRLYYPGEIEWGRYEKALEDGLELPEAVAGELNKLSQKFSLPVPWIKGCKL